MAFVSNLATFKKLWCRITSVKHKSDTQQHLRVNLVIEVNSIELKQSRILCFSSSTYIALSYAENVIKRAIVMKYHRERKIIVSK